ncbi:tol-pal system YbgF family protein [Schlesneria sp. DSM 10557]|uniref:tetratricopeptide repeat protein n=2 Tax=unclassified Schlesneria TaxID=2762017 RepID=UPI00359FD924
MKSEERHQLLTNDLGVVTTRTVGVLERHIGTVIGGIALLALLAGGIFWWTRTNDSEAATGWTLLDSAQNLEEFGDVVDKFKGKPPGQWAELFVAETNLKTALPLMFTNREIALVDLKSAREGFESLLQQNGVAPTIRERALWGYAICLEAASDGNTSKAVEAYEKLVQEFPESIFKAVAEDRAASLKRDNAKEFYTWFSRENPKPPDARPRDFKNEKSGSESSTAEPDDFLIRGSDDSGAIFKGLSKDKDLFKDAAADPVITPEAASEKTEATTEEKSAETPAAPETPAVPDAPAAPEKTDETPTDPAPSSEEEKPTEKE